MYEAIEKILMRALEVAEQTGAFVMEQAPLLLQEFYAWHLAIHIFGIVLLTISTIVPIIWVSRFLKKHNKNDGDYMDYLDTPLPIIWHCASAVSLGFLIYHIYMLLYITIAPKLYLIDYFLGSKPM